MKKFSGKRNGRYIIQRIDDFDITNDADTYGREILEEIRMEEKTVEEVEKMIQNNQFRMGAGLVAWLKWRMMR